MKPEMIRRIEMMKIRGEINGMETDNNRKDK